MLLCAKPLPSCEDEGGSGTGFSVPFRPSYALVGATAGELCVSV
jgi:hypothetical protein